MTAERRMKDSHIPWIGLIPEHWEVHCLRGISKGFKKGNGITKDDLVPEGDIFCIRYGDLYTKYNHHVYDIKCRTNLSKIQSPIYANYGDILFTCSGEDISLIGKSVAFMSKEDCLVGGDLIIMRHEQNPRFLGYSLDSEMAQQQKSCGRSKLKVVHISVKDLKNIAIPVPPLEEQERIAGWLDERCGVIDELIEVEQKMIKELEAYRQAIITETVTRGLNPDAPLRPTDIHWAPLIPQHWNLCRLKYLCDSMQSGDALTSMQINDSGKYKVYGGNGLRGYYGKSNFTGEAIIIGRQGALCGNVHYINDSIWATDHAVVTTPSAISNIKYLYYLTLGMNLNQYASQTAAQPGLAVGQIKNVLTVNPPMEEQIEIADYLDQKCRDIDELIALKREKIDTLKEYRQSLIFEAVTGKTSI